MTARAASIEAYLPLGYKLAWHAIRRGWPNCPVDDALQAAALGVVRAIDDSAKASCSIATVVCKRVRKELTREHLRWTWGSRRNKDSQRRVPCVSQANGVYVPVVIVTPDESNINRAHARRRVEQLLHLCTPKQRAVVLMRLDGLGNREIAATLQCSQNAAGLLYERGIKRMREAK